MQPVGFRWAYAVTRITGSPSENSLKEPHMLAVALLLPPLLLCGVLALGRYEERLLRGPAPAPHAPAGRHLRAVPDLPSPEPPETPAEQTPADRRTGAGRGRHAA